MLKALPINKKIQELGGSLPKIAKIFTTLDIELDSCYLQKDMPDTFFAYGYLNQTNSFVGKNEISWIFMTVGSLLLKSVITTIILLS